MNRSWEIVQASERSAPICPIHPVAQTGHLNSGRIDPTLNGEVTQDGDLNQMIWKVPKVIAYLSECFELAPGDVILSAPPAGAGLVMRGDVMEMSIAGLGEMTVKVI